MGIQGLVWEVFLEVRPHHERESAGMQVPIFDVLQIFKLLRNFLSDFSLSLLPDNSKFDRDS